MTPQGSLTSRTHNSWTRHDASFPSTASLQDHVAIQASFNECTDNPSVSNTVICKAVRPRVFEIQQDDSSYVRIKHHTQSLIDGGANICLTGDLSCLIGVIDIPPVPITVATMGGDSTLVDCCTKRGFLPLSLSDGTIYWQL